MIAARDEVARGVLAGGTVVGSLIAGVAVAALGARFGPGAMLAPAAAVFLVAAAVRRPVLAVLPVVAAFPIAAVDVPGPLRTVDLAVIAAVLAIATARVNAGGEPLAWSPPLSWAAALLLVVVAVTPYAIDTGEAVAQDIALALGVLLAAAVLAASRSFGDIRLVVAGVVGIGSAMCLVALGNSSTLRAHASGAVVANRVEGLLGQPNHLGGFAAVIVILAAATVVGGRTRRTRALATAAAMPALAALLLSLSRGAWIGLATGAVALAVLLPEARRRALVAGAALVVVAAAIGAFRPEAVQIDVVRARLSTVVSGDVGPYDDRPAIWAEARRQIVAKPLTGEGPGNFPVASARWRSEVWAGAWHAHNTLLTVAAEAGLPAAGLVVAFTLAVAGAVRRTMGRLRALSDRAVLAGCAAALVTFIGHGLVDFTLRQPVLRVLPWLLVGLVLAAARLSPRRGFGGSE